MFVGQHVLGVVALLLILSGPAPLSLSVVSALLREERPPSAAGGVLAGLVSWCVIQAAIAIGLGIAGYLSRPAVMLAEGAAFAGGLILMARTGVSLRALRRALTPRTALDVSETIIAMAVLSLLLALLWHCGTNPITDPDSLAYHLPAMAKWYQTGSFDMPEQYPFLSHYPYGWESLSFLFLLPFREDFPVALPNVVAWAMLGLAVYAIGRAAGASRHAGLAAASLAITLPIVVSRVDTMQIDLPLAAFVMSTFYLGLRYARSGRGTDLGLFLAAVGMVISIKASGLMYATLLLLLVVSGRLVTRYREKRSPATRSAPSFTAFGLACLGACSAVLIGGSWYIRNWLEVANPLGPIAVRLGGLVYLPGEYDLAHFRTTTLASVFAPWSYVDWMILGGQIWQRLGLPFLALNALVVAGVAVLLTRRAHGARVPFLGLIAVAIVSGYLYTVTPYSGDNGLNRWMIDADFVGHNMRFAIPCCAALATAAAVAATMARVPGAVLVIPAIAAVALRLLDLSMIHLLPAAMIGWLVILCAVRWARAHRQGRHAGWAPVATVLVVGLSALLTITLVARRQRDRQRQVVYGGIQHYIAQHVGPDETIGYFMSNRSYLLYGRDFSRNVAYIPLTSRECREWLDYLERADISVIAAGPVGQNRDAWETFDWLERGRMPVRRVFGRDFSRQPFLYRVEEALIEESDCGRSASTTPPVQAEEAGADGKQ